VKSPTSDLLKIEQQIASLPDGQKSIKDEVFILGLQPLEIDRVINFPFSSKHTIFKKGKYNIDDCGLVVHVRSHKMLNLWSLSYEIIVLCV
jgi:hypothetical protein